MRTLIRCLTLPVGLSQMLDYQMPDLSPIAYGYFAKANDVIGRDGGVTSLSNYTQHDN